ncbi:hypothetical protein LOK49_Contig712G00001, partial [Camellia lanceoleosa]
MGWEVVAYRDSGGDDLGSKRLAKVGGLSSQAESLEAEDGEVDLGMEAYRGISWAHRIEHSDITNGEGLALVLQPLATEGGGSEDLLGQHQSMFQTSGGLDGTEVPSSEAVSEWVLERIGEVNRCLGLLFEGHEKEAMSLYAAVEVSWWQGAPDRSGYTVCFLSMQRGIQLPIGYIYAFLIFVEWYWECCVKLSTFKTLWLVTVTINSAVIRFELVWFLSWQSFYLL